MLIRPKILDLYIFRKFLGTFFFALGLIILIAIVFDISEKIDDFLERDAPLKAIVFDYYFNFIPFFANLFSPLFVFISVIFFTSRMAGNTEIISILASGVSYRRFLMPYAVAALVIASISLYLNNMVLPRANVKRTAFELKYIKNPFVYKNRNVHRQIKPGEYIYFESYNNFDKVGYQFSYEKIVDGKMKYKLLSDRIVWDTLKNKWTIENYFIREIDSMKEKIKTGAHMESAFSFKPADFERRVDYAVESMDYSALNKFIAEEKMRGSDELVYYLIEKYKRISYPFATFILTLMGVTLSSTKVRGGIGMQLGLGILLSFTYIMFMQISTTFATNGNAPALLAVWIPNIVFSSVAFLLLRKRMTV